MIETIRDHTPRIDPNAVILPGAMVVGDVTIEADASVFFGAVLRGDVETSSRAARPPRRQNSCS